MLTRLDDNQSQLIIVNQRSWQHFHCKSQITYHGHSDPSLPRTTTQRPYANDPYTVRSKGCQLAIICKPSVYVLMREARDQILKIVQLFGKGGADRNVPLA
jgi:hypothetical protein